MRRKAQNGGIMGILKTSFGTLKDGTEVFLYTLENENKMKACLTNYGAIMVNLFVPDKKGKLDDVVLGFDNVEGYFDNPGYFGSTIGRNSNRIAGACFELNGEEYKLDKNEGENNLHGGFLGYNKRVWSAVMNEEENSVTFSIVSEHMDQGFPGKLDISVAYKLTNDNELVISYDGVCDKDTVVNMTNHSYFNLSGHTNESITDNELWIKSSKFNPVVDSASIPTGELAPVMGTPMDFTQFKTIEKDLNADYAQLKFTGGYDHNFVIDKEAEGIEKIAEVRDKKSGRAMEVYTDLPGVQLYIGNFINPNEERCKEGKVYKKRCALCLETQYYPDSVHQCEFPSPVLKAGERYNTATVYKFKYL